MRSPRTKFLEITAFITGKETEGGDSHKKENQDSML
jgi:hypothetical protein